MKIDTLILSGGGPSGIAYIGILEALFENNIINKELDGIKEIITTSIGILFSFILLIKIDIKIAYEIIKRFNVISMLNQNVEINDLLVDFGLFNTNGIENIFKSFTKNILQK